jgi:hypothetical protein
MAHILDLHAVDAETDVAASAPTAQSGISVLGCDGASSLSIMSC